MDLIILHYNDLKYREMIIKKIIDNHLVKSQ